VPLTGRVRIALGLATAAAISGSACRAGMLSRDGALAATLVGSAVFIGTGVRGSAALVTYVASSSLLGKLPEQHAAPQHRGRRRDAVQVVANGAVPALLALIAPKTRVEYRPLLHAAFGGAVAAAASDTWATEIGSRFGRNPRTIASLRPVMRGTSGGVTLAGLAASVAGATLTSALLTTTRASQTESLLSGIAIALGGIAGSLADSILGATLQEVRYCDDCGLETESLIHGCGARSRRIRGQTWCNNDTVNALAIGIGATTAVLIAMVSLHCNAARCPSWRR